MTVDFSRSERVGRLTLTFDDLNRLTPSRMDEFAAAVEAVPDDVSVLVVSGERGLSAGLHLGEAVDYDTAAARAMFDSLYGAVEAVRDTDSITVADCGAFALGAGFEIALGADFRVAEADDEIVGFVSFDAERGTVHVTQLAGSSDACEELLSDPIEFARREHMSVELLLPEDESEVRAAVEAVGFTSTGNGPRFDGQETTRYRLEPERAEH